MLKSFSSADVFHRRTLLLGAGKLGLLSVLVGRLAYLQIGQSGKYVRLSDGNRIKLRLLLPNRGLITDCQGEVLALNRHSFQVSILPEDVHDLPALISQLSTLINLEEIDLRELHRTIRRAPAFRPVVVKSQLTWEEVSKIEVHAPRLPGILIEVGQSRFYPYGELTTHIVGYMQSVSEKDKLQNQKQDRFLDEPGVKIGKAGIEKYFEPKLRGEVGVVEKEVDARGRVAQELSRHDSTPGATLALSIDLRLQTYMMNLLKERESGSAVVLHLATGKVLAFGSSPSFDGNLFVDGISQKHWQDLIKNTYHPLNNRITQGVYPPGSVFKMLVALAGLDKGVSATRKINCPGYISVNNHRFHCWKHKGGHGPLTLAEALGASCDVYFYELSKEIGIAPIIDMAKKFGLGAPTGIELPGEKSGLVPTKEWKLATKKSSWTVSDTILSSIGQGYWLATPMQLAVMTARLALGQAVVPTLLNDLNPHPFSDLGIDPKHLEVVQEGMWNAVNQPYGTVFRARITDPNCELAGKTSTAQVKRISMQERETGILSDKERPWEEREHALFVGFAPYKEPQVAVAVVIDHGGKGGAVAAPVGRNLILKAQKLGF